MKQVHTTMSTGLKGLDKILNDVLPGDNIVWQVDSIKDYVPFIEPFCLQANKDNRKLIYFRFADHEPLIPEHIKIDTYVLHPEEGFEKFIYEIFDVIEEKGEGACYVFDCLSELTVDWYSDRMLSNFFMLTCPYLYDYDTATYFALLRNHHMPVAYSTIHNTAQVVIDTYCNKEQIYIHPLKVYKRHTPTMYMLHIWKEEEFIPVRKSSITSEILTSVPQPWLDFTIQPHDVWTRTFIQAEQIINKPDSEDPDKLDVLFNRLLRMAITGESRLLELAKKYFDLPGLVKIGKRIIGTGMIGGKSVGMLLSRAILTKTDKHWKDALEVHDSFFIGSDAYYTYMIQNDCWWTRRQLKKSGNYLNGSEDLKQKMLKGKFSEEVKKQFIEMLDYFGQSPIIVRSSSLLEDAYGNSFSGKYDSVFCANQGTPQERLENFMNAVRKVYASAMKKEALAYRAHWGLLQQDEQMALLVQRVSGSNYNNYFFPQTAGVGFSFNPYVWNNDIEPEAGLIRLVFGLGTRAVDRTDDDYTRIVALNAPEKRPESNLNEVLKYTQRKVDFLNLKQNKMISGYFEDIAKSISDFQMEIFATRDEELEKRAKEQNIKNVFPYVLTFEKLLSETKFVSDMKKILKTLQKAYDYPIDIEFTLNFLNETDYKINILQCRPFQIKGELRAVKQPINIDKEKIILKTKGPIIGNSISTIIDWLIYIVPTEYSKLSMSERYSVARLIGELTHLKTDVQDKDKCIALVGPGRWGTTNPSLGVPVSFTEINTVSIICEIAEMHEGLIPDVSLGTHFFNDIVEMDMLYLALYPEREDYIYNRKFFLEHENRINEILPDTGTWSKIIRLIDLSNTKKNIYISVNSIGQEGICYIN